jgi:hypothetical protein
MQAIAATMAAALLASCASKQQPERAPEPPPRPQPQVVQRPVPAPAPPANWADAPLTPGEWTYRPGAAPEAWFGPAGGDPLFVVRCDPARRTVALIRPGAGPAPPAMQVTTSTNSVQIPGVEERAPLAGVTGSLAASNPLLDAMVFSRGRFMVAVPGLPRLILPAWPEPARVVEDCRG